MLFLLEYYERLSPQSFEMTSDFEQPTRANRWRNRRTAPPTHATNRHPIYRSIHPSIHQWCNAVDSIDSASTFVRL